MTTLFGLDGAGPAGTGTGGRTVKIGTDSVDAAGIVMSEGVGAAGVGTRTRVGADGAAGAGVGGASARASNEGTGSMGVAAAGAGAGASGAVAGKVRNLASDIQDVPRTYLLEQSREEMLEFPKRRTSLKILVVIMSPISDCAAKGEETKVRVELGKEACALMKATKRRR